MDECKFSSGKRFNTSKNDYDIICITLNKMFIVYDINDMTK